MKDIVLIQRIECHWSKASRGGPEAAQRNAVPEAVKVPVQALRKTPPGLLVEHGVDYSERRGFDAPSERITEEPFGRLKIGCVLIEPDSEGAWVVFEYDTGRAGAPFRYSPPGGRPATRFTLGPGQWGRVRYNGRFSHEEGGWTYGKFVFNVGMFPALSADVFLHSEPAHTVDQTALLW